MACVRLQSVPASKTTGSSQSPEGEARGTGRNVGGMSQTENIHTEGMISKGDN